MFGEEKVHRYTLLCLNTILTLSEKWNNLNYFLCLAHLSTQKSHISSNVILENPLIFFTFEEFFWIGFFFYFKWPPDILFIAYSDLLCVFLKSCGFSSKTMNFFSMRSMDRPYLSQFSINMYGSILLGMLITVSNIFALVFYWCLGFFPPLRWQAPRSRSLCILIYVHTMWWSLTTRFYTCMQFFMMWW